MDSEPDFIPRVQYTRRYQAPSSFPLLLYQCKQLMIPVDPENAVINAVKDVLSQLLNPLVWQETEGGVSRFDLAAAISTMLLLYDESDCGISGPGLAMDFFILQQQVTNAGPGETVPSNASARRNLNTEVIDIGDNVLLNNHQFQVQPGTWLFVASSPSVGNNGVFNFIKDASSGSTLITGKAGYQVGATNEWDELWCIGALVLTVPTTLELWQYSGQGYSAGFGFQAVTGLNIYSQVIGLKMA